MTREQCERAVKAIEAAPFLGIGEVAQGCAIARLAEGAGKCVDPRTVYVDAMDAYGLRADEMTMVWQTNDNTDEPERKAAVIDVLRSFVAPDESYQVVAG